MLQKMLILLIIKAEAMLTLLQPMLSVQPGPLENSLVPGLSEVEQSCHTCEGRHHCWLRSCLPTTGSAPEVCIGVGNPLPIGYIGAAARGTTGCPGRRLGVGLLTTGGRVAAWSMRCWLLDSRAGIVGTRLAAIAVGGSAGSCFYPSMT